MTAQEKAKLKGEGFLPQKEDGYFAVRIISHSGNFSTEELRALTEAAARFGRGYLGLTTRLSVEIPFVRDVSIPEMKAYLAEHGIRYGGTGKRVRPCVACKGTVCVHGLYDTQALSETVAAAHLGEAMPSKTKINFAGCPNNCTKVQINDIGVIGRRYPNFDPEKCVGCGACTRDCRAGALALEGGKAAFVGTCVGCGHCVDHCKFGAMTERIRGAEVYVGGVFGRTLRVGDSLGIFPVETLPAVIDALLLWYRENGQDGERIFKVIARAGLEAARKVALDAADIKE